MLLSLSDKGLDVTDPNLVQYTYSEHQHLDNLGRLTTKETSDLCRSSKSESLQADKVCLEQKPTILQLAIGSA